MNARRWKWFAAAATAAVLVSTGWAAWAATAKDDAVVTGRAWLENLKAQNPIQEENLQRVRPEGTPLSVGPDVTIIDLSGVGNYTNTSSGTPSACPAGYGGGNCRGYSIGTNSCNIGSLPVDWCDETSGCRTTTDVYHTSAPATVSDHSVIGQGLYRLKDGRFEQIGVSFLKHGFVSTNSPDTACVWNDQGSPNTSCVQPPAGGDQLGVGCTDFYSSGLNGGRPLGRRSDVNVADADHPANPAGGETNDDYDQRIVVQEDDLDPTLNSGALYWVEGQYVVRDDARSGPNPPPMSGPGVEGAIHPWLGENGLNNASYRQVTVDSAPALNMAMTGPTVRETAAIFAWQAVDPDVEIVNVDRQTLFAGDQRDPPLTGFYADHWILERFHAARRVTNTGAGPTPYHYEYAIHNMNSTSSAKGFSVEFPGATTFAGAGFHDIDHHSGEPYDTSDWTIDTDGPNGTITWTAVDAAANTNALRWGTTFTFWFDSSSAPSHLNEGLTLFTISETLDVPFAEEAGLIFSDGFESGTTGGWTQTAN